MLQYRLVVHVQMGSSKSIKMFNPQQQMRQFRYEQSFFENGVKSLKYYLRNVILRNITLRKSFMPFRKIVRLLRTKQNSKLNICQRIYKPSFVQS